MNDFIPYARQSINEADRFACSEALNSAVITRGVMVEKFEKQIAEYCGAKFAVAFNSGSTALLGASHAANINAYDQLISTPNTFVATVNGGVANGATLTFVDIDLATANLDLKQVAYTLEQPRSRGRPIIIPVHFAGMPVDVKALNNMMINPDAIVIEDACHAIGSCYSDGQRVGCCAWSQMTVFSFHPAKTITTGEGGLVTTNDEEFYHKLVSFRNNGTERSPERLDHKPAPWYYEVHSLTSNYNFTEFQAALGSSQLERIELFLTKRRELVNTYMRLLKGVPHITPLDIYHKKEVGFHLFVVKIDFLAYETTRTKVMEALLQAGIGTQVHYIPLYRHPYFEKKYGDLTAYFPNMESYYSQALSLPLYYDLTVDQVETVVSNLIRILNR